MRPWFLLLLAACVDDPATTPPPPPVDLAPMSLVMSPLVPGLAVDIAVHDAPPGALVELYRAERRGRGSCPPRFGGACLQMRDGLAPVVEGRADADGVARWHVPAFPEESAADWQFQAIVRGTVPHRSNPLSRPVRPAGADVDDPWEPSDGELPTEPETRRICGDDEDRWTTVLDPGEALSVGVHGAPDSYLVVRTEFLQQPDRITEVGEARWLDVPATDASRSAAITVSARDGACHTYRMASRRGPEGEACVDTAPPSGPLQLHETRTGHVCEGEAESWTVPLRRGVPVEIALEGLLGAVDFHVETPRGTTLFGTPAPSAVRPTARVFEVADTGPHLVHVRGVRDSVLGGGVDYTLTARPTTGCTALQDTLAAPLPVSFAAPQTVRPCSAGIGAFTLDVPVGTPFVVDPGDGLLVDADGARVRDPADPDVWVATRDRPQLLVRVSPTEGVAVLAIRLPQPPRCADDDYEPDGTEADASPMPVDGAHAGLLCPGDEDVIAVLLPPGDPPALVLHTEVEDARVSAYWRGPSLDAPPDPQGGLHHIRVWGLDASGYTLTLDPEAPASCPDDDDDDERATATRLHSGDHVEDVACDGADWYRVEVAAGEHLAVTSTVPARLYEPGQLWPRQTGHYLSHAAVSDTEIFVEVNRADGAPYTLDVMTVPLTCPVDVHEPNDDIGDAVTYGGSAVVCAGDRDHYLLDVQPGDRVVLELTGDVEDRAWLDAVGGAPEFLDDHLVEFQAAEPLAVVIVEPGREGPSADGVPYELSFRNGCPPDAGEPNDDQSSASPWRPGEQTLCDDDDWWFVPASPDERLRIETPPHAPWLAAEDGSPVTAFAEWVHTDEGGVYVYVPANDWDDTQEDYTVEVERAPRSCVPDAFEPNDDLFDASALAEGQTITASACSADWYRLDLDGSETVRVDVAAEGSGSVTVNLVDAAGTVLDSGTGRLTGQADGLAYLYVEPTDEAYVFGDTRYTLRAHTLSSVCSDHGSEMGIADARFVFPGETHEVCAGGRQTFTHRAPSGTLSWVATPTVPLLLTLQDDQGNRRARRYAPAGRTTALTYAADGAAVVLEVDAGNDAAGTYVLEHVLATACLDDGEADDAASARSAGTGTIAELTACHPGAADWFRFDIPPGETLTATASAPNAEGDLALRLYDDAGALLQESSTTADEEQVVFASPSGATVLVEVVLQAEAGVHQVGNVYDLTVTMD